jgi:lysophospholipase L1-like esterase
MVAISPETEGHVYNAATGGTAADVLAEQATEALAEVPTSEVVIVLTMGNDIRCDGTDADHVAEFGEGIGEALRVITDASPESKILIVGFFGRPTPEDVNAIIGRAPELKTVVTGSGLCDWYDPSGAIAPQSFETFYGIIDAYEAEQARVCAEVPQCSTDGGAAGAFEDSPDDYSDDYTHLNAAGLARFAEHVWPTVQELAAGG